MVTIAKRGNLTRVGDQGRMEAQSKSWIGAGGDGRCPGVEDSVTAAPWKMKWAGVTTPGVWGPVEGLWETQLGERQGPAWCQPSGGRQVLSQHPWVVVRGVPTCEGQD